MSSPRCVLDTNVLISALLAPHGLPNRLLGHVLARRGLLVSEALLEELSSRLRRPKFDVYLPPQSRERFAALLSSRGERVEVRTVVRDSSDPDDNPILALALDGRAEVLVTGDKKHLLPLHPYGSVDILTPRAFADRLGIQ